MTVGQDAVAESFVRQMVLESPAPVLQWLGENAVQRRLSDWISEELTLVGSKELGSKLKELCPVVGAATEDYVPRLHAFQTRGSALLRVRFKGGDPRWPFVQCVATNVSMGGPDELLRLAVEAKEAFAPLRPKCMRIWIASHAPWEPAQSDARFETGKRCIAAPLKSFGDSATVPLLDPLRVIGVTADAVFIQYALEYKSYLQSQPHAAGWCSPESLESLRECEKSGGLFGLMDGRKVAGIVALKRDSSPWFEGWYVVDSLLYQGYRNRKLAVPMHRAAYVQLVHGDDDVLWGTIDPRNLASVATAVRLGRTVIGGEWWVYPERDRGDRST